MTSVQTMFSVAFRSTRVLRARRMQQLLLLVVLTAFVTGCARRNRLHSPDALVSPYEQRELWAVAPFANESGVSLVDRHHIADLFTQQAEQIYGIETVPMNRVIAAMRHLGINSIESEQDAAIVMNVLNADALLVGSVTTWDPYRPPVLGIALEMYRRDSSNQNTFDSVSLTRSPTGTAPADANSDGLRAQAAGIFDANNHQTIAWLEQYAKSRTHPDSAFGTDIYFVSMDMYTQFVSYRLLHDLLDRERIRITPIATADEQQVSR